MSNLTDGQTEQILELRESGYSIREIASEVGVPKSTVERALKSEGPATVSPRASLSVSNQSEEVQKIIANNRHEIDKTKLLIERENNDLKKKELEARTLEASVQKARIEATQKALQQAENERMEKIEGRKRVLVDKFNRLLKEFTDNCQDSTWDQGDVEDFIDRGETLLEKVTALCGKIHVDEESLVIWNHLEILLDYMDEVLEGKKSVFGKAEIEFDLSKAERKRFKAYRVDDFDDIYEEPEEDEDLDDDDDDDFDDDDEVDEDEDLDEEDDEEDR